MEIDELWEALKNSKPPTKQDIKNLEDRLQKAEEQFAKESKAKQITNEWLNKEYTL